VRLTADSSQDDRDRYGRLLRYVVTKGGVDVGRRQLARGLAAVYVYDNVPFARVRAYRRVAAKARHDGRGVWSACGGQFHTPAGSG
jgi:micrococcal nuclease